MKRRTVMLMMVVSAVLFTACGKSSTSVSENDREELQSTVSEYDERSLESQDIACLQAVRTAYLSAMADPEYATDAMEEYSVAELKAGYPALCEKIESYLGYDLEKCEEFKSECCQGATISFTKDSYDCRCSINKNGEVVVSTSGMKMECE